MLQPQLQLCKVTNALFISNARSACTDDLIQQEAVTLCINVSKQQPFPESSRIAVLRVPVYDDPTEDLYRYFDSCADAIRDEASKGGHTVVYCKNGRSRSATICVAYLMKYRKLSLAEAFTKVRTSRSVVDPNSGFWAQLERYEQELRKRRGEVDNAPT
ncbi:dual specificity phosphatase 28 [Oncorhynchus masou masou]|uniref:dual specificity phosphatase 28 n=1 Tax=Oncorhynchus masou masou TaxID=90313 RepID=UPI0031836705